MKDAHRTGHKGHTHTSKYAHVYGKTVLFRYLYSCTSALYTVRYLYALVQYRLYCTVPVPLLPLYSFFKVPVQCLAIHFKYYIRQIYAGTLDKLRGKTLIKNGCQTMNRCVSYRYVSLPVQYYCMYYIV